MTKIVWILNLNHDSFYDGGKYTELEKAISRAKEMILQWVDIIEVWWFSTKPWSVIPPIQEELDRIIPTIEELNKLGIPICVETSRSAIVKKIKKYNNISYINDTSWLSDINMLSELKWTELNYMLMHMEQDYKSMNNIDPLYEDVVSDVIHFLEKKIELLEENGIKNIIIDPGFFFHKGPKENIGLIKNFSEINKLWYPIYIWLSRKSNLLKNNLGNTNKALIESYIMMFECLKYGVDFIRVHDIPEAVHLLKFYDVYSKI